MRETQSISDDFCGGNPDIKCQTMCDDSDEGGNGSDKRENEFENLDLMSAMARRPLTNTDEGER